jgi:GNAT superfamily N-acetyltransferase
MHAATAETAPVVVRRLRHGERRPVLEVFDGLGERSRRLRFLGPKPVLAPREVDLLVDVGCCGREAVAAVHEPTGATVGIARFVRDEAEPDVAEVAFEVVDEWQGRGIGSRLADELVVLARRAGLARLRATVAHDNGPALALVRRLGEPTAWHFEGATLEVLVTL